MSVSKAAFWDSIVIANFQGTRVRLYSSERNRVQALRIGRESKHYELVPREARRFTFIARDIL